MSNTPAGDWHPQEPIILSRVADQSLLNEVSRLEAALQQAQQREEELRGTLQTVYDTGAKTLKDLDTLSTLAEGLAEAVDTEANDSSRPPISAQLRAALTAWQEHRAGE